MIEPPLRDWTGYPVGAVAATATTLVAVAAGGTGHPEWTLVALTTTAATVACVTTMRAGLTTAALCWALHSSFVLGRHGELMFTPDSAHAAVVLAAATLAACGIGAAVRIARVAHVVATPTQRQASGDIRTVGRAA